MSICLDTNAYSAFKRGDAVVIDLVEAADEIAIPSIVLGELFAGFRMGSRARRNVVELEDFLHRPGVSVAAVTKAVAERYGTLVSKLKQQGTPLPTTTYGLRPSPWNAARNSSPWTLISTTFPACSPRAGSSDGA